MAKKDMQDEEFINMCDEIVKWQKIKNKTICLSGGFDPMHVGHLSMIEEASKFGKVIIILNSDIWLDRKKGYHLMTWSDRAVILKALKYVYDVVPVDDINGGTVCEALKSIKPTFFGNGGDRNQTNTPEVTLCEELGIELVWGLGGNKIQSSSELVDSVVNRVIEKLTLWK
jgi:D-beta-D-heptose 7-phosphate kinase/D-beta-D-heptose 1-phosphate adenosyltransferase